MPRVALTEEQKQQYAVFSICKAILDELNSKRGRDRKSGIAFAEELGIAKSTWFRWNNGGLEKAEFGTVVLAAYKSGFKLTIEKI